LTNSAAVVQAWLQSWCELYSYLDVVIPQHVIAAPPLAQNPLRLSQTTTQRLTSEAFRWVSFHINRFVFDQLFYGGVVRLQQGPNDAQFQIRLVLEYRVPPPDGREREHIEALRQILKDPRFGIDIAWARVPSAAQGPATANLDVTWRWLK